MAVRGIVTPVDLIETPATGRYTLTLGDSNRVSGIADCNRMVGPYTLDESAIGFGPLITTRMACPAGGVGDRYVQWLEAAAASLLTPHSLLLTRELYSWWRPRRKADGDRPFSRRKNLAK